MERNERDETRREYQISLMVENKVSHFIKDLYYACFPGFS